VSDGVNTQPCMAATQCNHLFTSEQIQPNCIVQLTEYVPNIVQNKRLLILLGINFIHPPVPTIGNPVPFLDSTDPQARPNSAEASAPGAASMMTHMQQPSAIQGGPQRLPTNAGFGYGPQTNTPVSTWPAQQGQRLNAPSGHAGTGFANHQSYPVAANFAANSTNVQVRSPGAQHLCNVQQNPGAVAAGVARGAAPWNSFGSGAIARMNAPPLAQVGGASSYDKIASLNPYKSAWTIRGRISYKGDLRKYQNAKGEGVLFSFEITDESANIKCTSFKETAEAFEQLIQMNKVYSISHAQLKPADARYNRTSSQLEMTLDSRSEIKMIEDDGSVPRISYNFVKLAALEGIQNKGFCDVLAVVVEISEITTLASKTTGEPLFKRTFSLVDDSGCSVPLTVWGEMCEKLTTDKRYPVLLCKGVRRGDFQGISLDAMKSTYFEFNPDIPEAHALRGWYDSVGSSRPFTALGGQGAGSADRDSERKTLEDVILHEQPRLFNEPKGIYYTTRVYVMFIKRTGALYYTACPETGRKVIELSPGRWRCEYTDKEYDHCHYKYILSLNMGDSTRSQWMSAFDEVGKTILGCPASDIAGLEGDDPIVSKLLSEASYKQFICRVRIKSEEYMGESRIKHQIFRADPVDFTTESKLLLQEIKQLESR